MNVIIIGATSGIGRELAKIYSKRGDSIGITGRRLPLLETLKSELSSPVYLKTFDISDLESSSEALNALISDMGGVDIIIVNSGIGLFNKRLSWEKEKETIDVNVSGFSLMLNVAFNYFRKMGKGHIVGISSIAALRGGSSSPAYNASKAFISNYLESLRCLAYKSNLPITITDVKPGFVKTEMIDGDNLFWVAPAEKAAKQIFNAINAKSSHVYITKRWRLIAWILKIVPFTIYRHF